MINITNIINIGPKQQTCPQLHAHDEDMELVVQDKYLGDYITSDGKHDKTISARCSSGTGQTSALMTILKEVSLGQFYFPMATLLRSTLVMSSMLLNAES